MNTAILNLPAVIDQPALPSSDRGRTRHRPAGRGGAMKRALRNIALGVVAFLIVVWLGAVIGDDALAALFLLMPDTEPKRGNSPRRPPQPE
jgi:hypothetical protein